ncbi:hypothetical protein CC86DRAFT_382862 [Ophiobolus disseminans]|uniref:Uncharacterized protein n=1 Tax=Ophiobolus disseminans TaxID=1469910 RepID=A0A6A6ZXV3_9PLEO|nr:hypothetical protein CC86DRAFT_382862 [Ophiobolus disseminans]
MPCGKWRKIKGDEGKEREEEERRAAQALKEAYQKLEANRRGANREASQASQDQAFERLVAAHNGQIPDGHYQNSFEHLHVHNGQVERNGVAEVTQQKGLGNEWMPYPIPPGPLDPCWFYRVVLFTFGDEDLGTFQAADGYYYQARQTRQGRPAWDANESLSFWDPVASNGWCQGREVWVNCGQGWKCCHPMFCAGVAFEATPDWLSELIANWDSLQQSSDATTSGTTPPALDDSLPALSSEGSSPQSSGIVTPEQPAAGPSTPVFDDSYQGDTNFECTYFNDSDQGGINPEGMVSDDSNQGGINPESIVFDNLLQEDVSFQSMVVDNSDQGGTDLESMLLNDSNQGVTNFAGMDLDNNFEDSIPMAGIDDFFRGPGHCCRG